MLTDRELGTLKPREKIFKVTDRDGMYAAVLPSGTVSFRYDYRLNGRRETLAIGRYDADLARNPAREPETLEYGMDIPQDSSWAGGLCGRQQLRQPQASSSSS